MTSSTRRPLRLQNTTLLLLSLLLASSNAFTSPQTLSSSRNEAARISSTKPTTTRLYANQFDITKPTFDLLSFRQIRSDALLRYNSLNQSEPLRINLFLLLTASLSWDIRCGVNLSLESYQQIFPRWVQLQRG